VLGYDLLNLYKEEANTLRSDVDDLMNNLIDKNESVLADVHPELIEDYKSLK
jgi:hypothetical protein